MNALIAAQAAIRQQAEEQQEAAKDLASWISQVKKKDDKLKASSQSVTRRPERPPPSSATQSAAVYRGPNNSAADHTYDRGYRKWESFDVDAALQEGDSGDCVFSKRTPEIAVVREAPNPMDTKKSVVNSLHAPVLAVDAATAAREAGNACFKRGDYTGAVAAYTRALLADPKSATALSNRAAAHLQLKAFRRALDDATNALRIEPRMLKAWWRRCSALQALGCHEAAERDAQVMLAISPGNKEAQAEARTTSEARRACARHEPELTVPVRAAAVAAASKPCAAAIATLSGDELQSVGIPPQALKTENAARIRPVAAPTSATGAVNGSKSGGVESAQGSTAAAAASAHSDAALEHASGAPTSPRTVKGDALEPLVPQEAAPPAPPQPSRAAVATVRPPPPPSLPTASARTAYELEKQLRALRGVPGGRSRLLLEVLRPGLLPGMFRSAMDADALAEIVVAVAEGVAVQPPGSTQSDGERRERGAAVLRALLACPQLDLSVAMLGASNKARLAAALLPSDASSLSSHVEGQPPSSVKDSTSNGTAAASPWGDAVSEFASATRLYRPN